MWRIAEVITGRGIFVKCVRLMCSLAVALSLLGVSIYAEIPSSAAAKAQLFIQPSKGTAGTKVLISGSLLTPSTSGNATVPGVTTFAKVYFPNKETLVATTAIDHGGNFETYITLGEYSSGEQKFWVLDNSASPPSWSSISFTVLPKVTISAAYGYEGDNVTVSGSGFAGTAAVKVYYDSKFVAETTSSASGSFAAAGIILPPSIRGNHLFSAVDAAGNNASVDFVIHHSAVLDSPKGQIGTLVSFRGASFLPDSIVTVSINDSSVVTSPSIIKSSPSGNFTGVFYFPSLSVGTYNVRISDDHDGVVAPFQVTLGGTLNRIVGYSGSAVTYTGSGFVPGRIAVLSFNDTPVGEGTVNPGGNVKLEFKVPDIGAGEYNIAVTDGTNKTTHTFSVLGAATYTANRESGNVGSEIVFSGSRFLPGKVLTFNYDERPVGEVNIDDDGEFTYVLKAPAGKSGIHTIIASDGINTANWTFILEAVSPPSPLALTPFGALEADALPVFKWEGVNDPSGVIYTFQLSKSADFGSANATDILLTRSALTAVELSLPAAVTLPAGEYYWRVKAVDLAENASEWSETAVFTILPESSYWFMLSVVGEVGIFSTMFGVWIVRKRRQSDA